MAKFEYKSIPGYKSNNFESGSGNNGDNGNKINIPKPTDIEERLHKSIIGQKEAVKNFAKLKKVIESGFRPGKGPIDVEWLSGPSGVGKTEMVKKMVDLMLEDHPQYDEDGKLIEEPRAADHMIRIDGGSYQGEHEIAKVLGSPPGYVGSGGAGNSYVEPILSQSNIERNSIYYTDERGNERKVCVILIDEAEKANQALYRTLLSALDDGVLTLNNNEKVDLSDCVFLFTSNLGNQEVADAKQRGDKRTPEEIYQEAYKGKFPAEFLGRVRKTNIFEHLSREEVGQIVSLRLKEIESVFASNGTNFNLDVTPEVTDWLVDRGYSKSEGARAMQKLMNDIIQEPLIAIDGEYILDRKNIVISVSSDGKELEFSTPDGDPEPRTKIEKKPNAKPRSKPESPETKPSSGPKPEKTGSSNKLEHKLEFYKNFVDERIRESLNADNVWLIDELCDVALKAYMNNHGFSLANANNQVKMELRKTYNYFRQSEITNAEELIIYFEDLLKDKFNIKVTYVDHCEECEK